MEPQKTTKIEEIFSFLPERAKEEAVDYLEFLYSKYVKDREGGNKARAFEIIDNYKGTVDRWNREELYER